MRSLYVCYFNTEEPLVHTQVLPYLRALSESGIKMHLLTYEKRSAWIKSERNRRRELKQRLNAAGIRWHALKYHKRPSLLATGFDVLLGIIYSAWLIIRHRINILHARSHVPGVICLPLKLALRRKLIFDLRGLMAEEYVDNGVWATGSLPFRLVKAAERALLKHADRIITLTEKMKAVLAAAQVDSSKISVIPCCVDLSKYDRAQAVKRDTFENHVKLVYVGSATGRYLLGEMIDFFKALKSKLDGAHFLVITKSDQAEVSRAFRTRGVEEGSYSITSADPDEVAERLASCDVGILFIEPGPALIAGSPTKIGEYFAAGLPLVSTSGVGDTDGIVQAEHVGIIVDEFDAPVYANAADQVIALIQQDDVRERCREVAEKQYSLADVGEPSYIAVYDSLREQGTQAASLSYEKRA